MFGSEVCIFFDPDYFNSFFARRNQYEFLIQLKDNLSLVEQLNLELPEVLTEIGFEFRNNNNGLDGLTDYTEQWWSIREK